MASSIIHLAITNELTKRLSFTDVSRLEFGAVVVDAGVGGNQNGNSHMKINVQDGKKKIGSSSTGKKYEFIFCMSPSVSKALI